MEIKDRNKVTIIEYMTADVTIKAVSQDSLLSHFLSGCLAEIKPESPDLH